MYLRLTCGSTVSIKVSAGNTRSLGSRARASTLQPRAAWSVSDALETSMDSGIPTALIRKLRQIHWSRKKLAAMRPQSCSRRPCNAPSLKETRDCNLSYAVACTVYDIQSQYPLIWCCSLIYFKVYRALYCKQIFTDLEPSPVCGFCSHWLKFPSEDWRWQEMDTGL